MTKHIIRPARGFVVACLLVAMAAFAAAPAMAHGVSGSDADYLASAQGWNIFPYMYLGAKHMVSGYDHLLFLVGVIFFLYRMKDIVLYVTMFSVGHSITLLSGVLGQIHMSAYLVDAVIGLSVVYKAFDNLGGFTAVLGVRPNQKLAVLAFGLVHGFGLATKLQDLQLSADGLIPNMLAFNAGVELGQILALSAILLIMTWWRSTRWFERQIIAANVALMIAGFLLFQYQIIGYVLELMA